MEDEKDNKTLVLEIEPFIGNENENIEPPHAFPIEYSYENTIVTANGTSFTITELKPL